MLKKVFKCLRLTIADVKWEAEHSQAFCFNNCFPVLSINSYKPSFVAKHTQEEMEHIIRKDIEELKKMLNDYSLKMG